VIPAIFRRPVLGLWDRNGVISRLARRGINGIPAYPRPHRNIRQTQRKVPNGRKHGLRGVQLQRMEQPRLKMSDTSADVLYLEVHG
jgi:hypothetical protein